MRKHGGLGSAIAFLALFGTSGCLPTMPSEPQSVTDPDAAPPGLGTGSNASADLGSAPDDGGAAAATDLGQSGGGGDMAVVCDKVQATNAIGQHNAGQECQGCHGPGGGAPRFYLGGTIYSAASGGTAVVGATINVTDAAGKTLKLVSAKNGNFWTTTALTYPVRVNASLCPNTLPMSATVPADGACNNCHNATFRVHVP